jgi:hypothetical protein
MCFPGTSGSTRPKLVDQEEWRTHAERWRKSIDEGHGAHAGGPARYFDGTPFNPVEAEIEKKIFEILSWIYAHLKDLKA